MCRPLTVGKRLNLQPPVANHDRMARRNRLDALGREADIQQRHAFAGRREQRPLDRVAQRLDSQRIPRHHHVAQRIEEYNAIRPVKLSGEMTTQINQLRPTLRGQCPANLVHQHFGVRLAGEIVVVVVEQLLAKIHVIGQLAIECEAEPLVFLDVMPLERLGIAAVVLAAGGVTHMPNGCSAGILLHQTLVLTPVTEAKNLAHPTLHPYMCRSTDFGGDCTS